MFEKEIFTEFNSEERAYAISQIDPFHDYPYRVVGQPSDYDSPSVIMTVNQEKVFNASDFGLSTAEGSKWDFQVALLPMLQQATYYSSRLAAPCHLTTGGSSDESPYTTLYPITVHAATAGGKTFEWDTTDPEPIGISTNLAGYFSNASSTIQVPRVLRVAAIAFEVVDETPKYYQQGSVTCYLSSGANQRSPIGVTATLSGQASNSSRTLYANIGVAPVNSISQATIIPNSKTWKASEGCYVVGRRFSEDNPFVRPMVSDIVLYAPNDPDSATLKNSWVSRELANAANSSTTLTNFDSFNCMIPYHTSGAYFTGVSGQYGTFRLRTKIMYEILPDPLDTTLIPLGIPPLKRNPVYEYRLAKLIAELPAYCPQSMNPKGEWWRNAVKIYKKVSGVAKRAVNSDITKDIASNFGLSDELKGIQKIVNMNATLANKVDKLATKEKKKKSKEKKDKPKTKSTD